MKHPVFTAGERQGDVAVPVLLFAFLGAPVIWAIHLAVAYFLVTWECQTGWGGADWSLGLTTAVLAAASAGAGWTALRIWRRLGPQEPEPNERDWLRFLLVAGMAGSALFTTAIVLEGLAPLFVPLCS